MNGEEWNRFETDRYISSRPAMRQGWASFKYIMERTGNEDEKKEWVERFLNESPEETLQQAVYFRIHQSMRRGGATVTRGTVEEDRNGAGENYIRTTFTSGCNTYYLDWFEDSGTWRIRSGDVKIRSEGLDGTKEETIPEASSEAEKAFKRFPSGWMVGVDVGQIAFRGLFDETAEFGFGIKAGYQVGIWKVASIGSFLTIQNEHLRSDFDDSLQAIYSLGVITDVNFPEITEVGFPLLVQKSHGRPW